MQKTLNLFNQLVDTFLKDEAKNPVVKPVPPEELEQHFDILLNENGMDDIEFQNALEKIVLHTPKIASKQFYNQLYGGRNNYAVLGDLLAVVLNTSMYTYKVAGPMVGVEKAIIEKSCELIGMQDGVGAMAPGGSMTNLMSMIMARDWKDDQARFKGIQKQLIAYTSIDSHYSIVKNAAFTGLGRDNVRHIATNEKGEMIPEMLELAITKDIAQGFMPFYINATAGTTVLGAFDPIEELSQIAKKYQLWLHVDGAYCGASFFSHKHRGKLKGLDRVDSFSYNGHKMLNTPTNCSFILTPHKNALYDSFSSEASYLFQKDSDEYNFGKTSMQCGRRNDALKFWTLWKAIGTNGLGAMVDHLFETADTAFEYVTTHPDYSVHSFPGSLSVCFNYKGIDAKTLSHSLHDEGVSLVSYAELNETSFIRFVNINTMNSNEDVLNFFKTLEEHVEKNKEHLLSYA